MSMPKLTDEARAFVVCALACFDAPTAVALSVREEFTITITPQAVEAYDPTKRAGRRVAPKWRALFEKSRADFLENASSIPVAHRSVRLRRLDRMATRAEEAGNIPLAAQLLEQAAKECGDVYTNRQRVVTQMNVLSHEEALAELEADDQAEDRAIGTGRERVLI